MCEPTLISAAKKSQLALKLLLKSTVQLSLLNLDWIIAEPFRALDAESVQVVFSLLGLI